MLSKAAATCKGKEGGERERALSWGERESGQGRGPTHAEGRERKEGAGQIDSARSKINFFKKIEDFFKIKK